MLVIKKERKKERKNKKKIYTKGNTSFPSPFFAKEEMKEAENPLQGAKNY